MTRHLVVPLLLLTTSACSLAIRAELLNPLNKSGRVEQSGPAPTPTPTPTPTPGGTL